ncbi:PREDICTED: HMG-Y-related protein A-like [Ipomoea nil]|uniref:HMG-Y-related protein A-like n=1 Tax=Ipomoea nil TaxID=35883 RepID=UPI0009014C14|nr:PREDICTED: HMG-Y-related protein A-like [Ipomoea nil]
MASPDDNPVDPPPPSSNQPPPTLPLYPEMIMAAIEELNHKNGSNKSTIARKIEATYGALPQAFHTLLSHHLNKMRQSGQLLFVKNNYMKPDPNAPQLLSRGRGRPPKPKAPPPPGYVPPTPRPRGRPPKARDPLAPAASPKKKSAESGGTGRKRGRPRKYPKTSVTPAVAAPSSDAPRRRGRPPKVKPAVAAPVGA